jgi:uncharacterized protein YceK
MKRLYSYTMIVLITLCLTVVGCSSVEEQVTPKTGWQKVKCKIGVEKKDNCS